MFVRDPRVGDPLHHTTLTRASFFFRLPRTLPRATWDFLWTPHYTPPSPTHDMGTFFPNALQIWPQKGAFRPLLAVKFVPWQAPHPGGASLAHLRGLGGALAPKYTLRKGLTWPDSPLAQ